MRSKFEEISLVYPLLILGSDFMTFKIVNGIKSRVGFSEKMEISPLGLWKAFKKIMSIIGIELHNGWYEKRLAYKAIYKTFAPDFPHYGEIREMRESLSRLGMDAKFDIELYADNLTRIYGVRPAVELTVALSHLGYKIPELVDFMSEVYPDRWEKAETKLHAMGIDSLLDTTPEEPF